MYAKRSADLARGKPHGSVDLGLSVISAKRRRCRIDIDAEVFIYHIKVRPRKKKHFLFFYSTDSTFYVVGEIARRICKMVGGLERAPSVPTATAAQS